MRQIIAIIVLGQVFPFVLVVSALTGLTGTSAPTRGARDSPRHDAPLSAEAAVEATAAPGKAASGAQSAQGAPQKKGAVYDKPYKPGGTELR